MDKMFCFQCEQTARCEGCTIQGVCGKTAETANLQDSLTKKYRNKRWQYFNCWPWS